MHQIHPVDSSYYFIPCSFVYDIQGVVGLIVYLEGLKKFSYNFEVNWIKKAICKEVLIQISLFN